MQSARNRLSVAVRAGGVAAGMPAFGPRRADEEIWGLGAFVQEMAGMSEEEYARWEARFTTGRDTTNEAAGHTHAPGTPDHSH